MKPSVNVFFTEFVNVGVAVYLDVVPCLCDIDAVEHVHESLAFEWDTKVVIDIVEEHGCCLFVLACNGEIIHLSHEDNALFVDEARVEAWFMDSWRESYVAKDAVGVFFP